MNARGARAVAAVCFSLSMAGCVSADQFLRGEERPLSPNALYVWQYAKAQDFQASVRQGSWEFLETQVSRERPIIAFLNLGFRQVPLGHFLVVVGVDPEDKSVIAYSGVEKNQRIPFDRFKEAWEKTNYWSLLIEPQPGPDEGA